MKSAFRAWLAAVVVLGLSAPPLWAFDVTSEPLSVPVNSSQDRLLVPDLDWEAPDVKPDHAAAVVTSHDAVNLSERSSLGLSGEHSLESVASAISTHDDHKASTPSGISAVPEPSAIALAGLALIYFLVFGRRRRMV